MPSISLAPDLHTLFQISTSARRQDTCVFTHSGNRCSSSLDARSLGAGLNVDILWQWPHIAIQDPRLLEKLELIGDRFLCIGHSIGRQNTIAEIAQAWLKKVEDEVSKFRTAIATALPGQQQLDDPQMQQMRALLRNSAFTKSASPTKLDTSANNQVTSVACVNALPSSTCIFKSKIGTDSPAWSHLRRPREQQVHSPTMLENRIRTTSCSLSRSRTSKATRRVSSMRSTKTKKTLLTMRPVQQLQQALSQ